MSESRAEISLVVRDGRGAEKSYSFAKNQLLIGRTVACDVTLDEPAAGKEHARIIVSAQGAVKLKDLGTSTGTQLNGSRIDDSLLISTGDELRIGDTTIQVRIKKNVEALGASRDRVQAARWKAYEMPHKPVLNIAQLWGDAVVAVSRFGKSAKHIWHAFVFVTIILSLELWLASGFYASMNRFYQKGEIADYGPAMMWIIVCFVLADILIAFMTLDLFIWPRQSQFRTVRIGQSRKADFFVPEEALGTKLYNLIVSFKGKPALNLQNNAVQGKVLVDGQVLSMDDIRKTGYVKEKFFLPLNYKLRARAKVGHVTFILGLDPALREPRGALLSRINVPILASFSMSFFLAALFLLAVMAAPKSQPVVRVATAQSRTFKTLIKAEKQKKKEEKKEKAKIKEEKKEEEKKKKKDEEDPLKEEIEKDPLLEEKIEIKKEKVIRKMELKPKKVKSIETNLKPNKKKKKKLSSMTTPVSKDKIRKTGALGALNTPGMKAIGTQFGGSDFAIDSSFQPAGDLAIAGLDEGGEIDLGGSADSDPFDLSKVQADGTTLGGEAGPGAGGFGSVLADGSAVGGRDNSIAGKGLDELSKKRVSSSVKNPKFKDKKVKITPSASFDMSGGGKLDRAVVKKYIRKQLAKIRWCYQKAFQRNPDLEGKLTVSFVISPTGSVMKSKVVKSTLGDKELENCIERKIMTWRFPAPQGGGVLKINYPFVLRKQ
jgi:TonB family protein